MSKIEIKHLSKSYNDVTVLNDVSIKIEQGDIYGVLGLSGAGKSTLVRCINGLETFDKGEIYFNDQLLADTTHAVPRLLKRKIAMIFQSFNLLQQATVLKNVEFALELNKKEIVPEEDEKELTTKQIIRKRAMWALKRVGLEEKAKSYPSSLSGGQAQRVAIARAIVMKPEVLLSDEATSALDPDTTKSVLELLKELNKELNLTIIMISHQMNVIEQICNKVAIIDKSKIVEEGSLSDVFLNPKADISKKLIYSNHVNTSLEETRSIRFLFNGDSDRPLVASIVQDCGIVVSIIYADTKTIDGKVYGQLMIKRPSEEKIAQKLIKYLQLNNISFEEVNE